METPTVSLPMPVPRIDLAMPLLDPAISAIRLADSEEDGLIEGLLVPYGGSFNGKDSYGTFASPQTRFCLDLFPDGARPLLYHHGLDSTVGPVPVGRIRSLEQTATGIWMKAQLDLHNEYIREIRDLIKKGALGLSSGALAHLVEIDARSGQWIQWPIAEGSMTPAPSNLLATIDLTTFKSHVRAAGIDLPAATVQQIEAGADQTPPAVAPAAPPEQPPAPGAAPSDAGSTATRAAAAGDAGSSSSYEDLMEDLRRALNPGGPWSSGYASLVETHPDFLICCYWSDDPDDDNTYWRVAYTLDADGEPVLGERTRVAPTYAEVPDPEARSASAPFVVESTFMKRQILSWHAGAKALLARRAAEERLPSPANCRAVTEVRSALLDVAASLHEFLSDVETRRALQSERSYLCDPTVRKRELELLQWALDALPPEADAAAPAGAPSPRA